MFCIVNIKQGRWVDVLDTKDDVVERISFDELFDIVNSGLVVRGCDGNGDVRLAFPEFKKVFCRDSYGVIIMEIISGNSVKKFSGILFYNREDVIEDMLMSGLVELRGVETRNFEPSDIESLSSSFGNMNVIDIDINNSSLSGFWSENIPVYWYRWLRIVDPDKRKVLNLDITACNGVSLMDTFGKSSLWDLLKAVYMDGFVDILSDINWRQ